MPILLGLTILVGVRASRAVSAALLGCMVLSGLVLLSPYDRFSGRYAWHLEYGHYGKVVEQAHDNRLMARTIPEVLNRLPEGAVLVGTLQWTIVQARVAGIVAAENFDGVPGLVGFHFPGAPGRALISFQDAKLKDLLEKRRAATAGGLYFDSRLEGMLRRWMSIEIANYAKPVDMTGRSLRSLLSAAGLSNAEAVAPSR